MEWLQRLPTTKVVDRARYVLDVCHGKSVLHLGCIDSGLLEERIQRESWLHYQILQVAASLKGIDIDQKGIAEAKKLGIEGLIHGNIERLDEVPLGEQFEVVLAGEVIEHLANPGLFLETVKRFMQPNGILVITTPNPFRIENLLFILLNRECIHPDHLNYGSYVTLKNLFKLYGYEIADIKSHNLPFTFRYNPGRDNIIRYTGKLGLKLVDILIKTPLLFLTPYVGNGFIFTITNGKGSKNLGNE